LHFKYLFNKNIMKKYLCSFLFLLIFQNISSQNIENINLIFEKISNEENDSVKFVLNDSIKTILTDFFEDEKSFSADFKQVKYIGKITSKDHLVNIYTWDILLENSVLFNCFVQQKNGKIDFLSQKDCYKPTENQTISPNNWYGALYYRIVPFKRNDKTYYVLAGYGRYQPSTKIKVLDVLDLHNDTLLFGHPVFLKNNKIANSRVVFEYDANSTMFLEYNEKKSRFEFDHLEPMRVEDEEVLSFAPDTAIDGYKLEGNYWKFIDEVKIKIQKIKGVKKTKIKPRIHVK